jgi:hypothetical protein
MPTENEAAKTDEEHELVTAPDGKTYRILKNYVPLLPIPITESEGKVIDASVASMVKRFQHDGIKVERPRFVCQEEAPCKALDEIIASTLWALRHEVPHETAEKLLQRLGSISPESDEDALAVGVFFIRFMDTMEAMVSYKRRYRGRPRERCKYTKDEALEILRQRGLTRR